MPDTIIKDLRDTAFSHEDVIDLIHLSFKKREEQGLHFSCSSMSGEEFAEDTKSGKTFVAIDSDSGRLVGTASVRVYDKPGKKKYGLFEYLAVHPEATRRGVASELLNTCIRSCQEEGAAQESRPCGPGCRKGRRRGSGRSHRPGLRHGTGRRHVCRHRHGPAPVPDERDPRQRKLHHHHPAGEGLQLEQQSTEFQTVTKII